MELMEDVKSRGVGIAAEPPVTVQKFDGSLNV